MAEWYFPDSSGGETQGLNEPGVEMFKETDSLARETVQNILDNGDKSGKPRVVEFELLDLPFQNFPNLDQFREIFIACQQAMSKLVKNGTANEQKFFEQGLALLKSGHGTIPTLRIRDLNTTGLVGGDDEEDQPFCRLLRVQGVSSAQGPKGGTYGIGQRAPFHCSAIRTIIYYTRREDKEQALIAKSILCSHAVPAFPKRKRQAKGWWCIPNKDEPDAWKSVRDTDAIPSFFRREAPGTDLYVTGFVLYPEWERVIRHAVLRNFFAAIDAEELEVRILERGKQLCSITKSTLESEVAKAANEQRNDDAELARNEMGATHAFLRALRHGKQFKKAIKGLGEVRLHVHRDLDDDQLPDSWGYMRKPHMLVGTRDARVIRRFAAVLICDNTEGNDFLSRLEGPQHREWKASELRNATPDEVKDAERVDKLLREFVRESLKSMKAGANLATINPPNLGNYLPDEEPENGFEKTGTGPTTTGNPTERELAVRTTPVVTPRPARPTKGRKRPMTVAEEHILPSGPDHEEPTTPEHHGKRPTKTKTASPGDGLEKRVISPQAIDCRSYVDGEDCILVVRARTSVDGNLRLIAVGESGRPPPLNVLGAIGSDGTQFQVSGAFIRDLKLKKDETSRIRVRLDLGSRICLGVGG
jgi:hypothetical protein